MNNLPKRRHVFIKKAFQGRLILAVLALIMLSGLCSALLIYWLIDDDLKAQWFSAHAAISEVSKRLGLSILIGSLVSLLLAGGLSVVSVLYASHKIAGPLYRFEKLCERIGNGELDKMVQLREKDQLQALAQAFSDMLEKLRSRRHWRNEHVAKLKVQVEI